MFVGDALQELIAWDEEAFVPMRAAPLRPITMAHSTSDAPELSMQLMIDLAG